MKEVSTREEFNLYRNTNSQPIICRGVLAREMKSKKRIATVLSIIGIVLFVVGITAIIWIYCGQSSSVPEVSITGSEDADVTKSGGVHIGGVSISTAALAILVGGILALIGILKGRKIQLNADGSVIVN